MVLVKDSGLMFIYMIVVADTGFESMMYNLLSIHALDLQIFSLADPISFYYQSLWFIFHNYMVWALCGKPDIAPAVLSTCLEFTSKIHLKHTIFPLENTELIYLQIPDELDMF